MEGIFEIKIEGATPLIMHNAQGADPLHPYTKEKKPIVDKRSKKTDADFKKLAELDFLSSLYWSEDLGGLYIPVENVFKMLLQAGRLIDQRKTKSQIVGIRFNDPLGWPVKTKNRSNLKALVKDPSNKYFQLVNVGKNKTPNTKGIFHEWSFDASIIIDDEFVDPSVVEKWWEVAGRIGIEEARRPYARKIRKICRKRV